jgi:hypothetical protein
MGAPTFRHTPNEATQILKDSVGEIAIATAAKVFPSAYFKWFYVQIENPKTLATAIDSTRELVGKFGSSQEYQHAWNLGKVAFERGEHYYFRQQHMRRRSSRCNETIEEEHGSENSHFYIMIKEKMPS